MKHDESHTRDKPIGARSRSWSAITPFVADTRCAEARLLGIVRQEQLLSRTHGAENCSAVLPGVSTE